MIIWQEDFPIRSYDVDLKNRLRISQLFNFMQEAAGNHAYELGCGYDDLIKQNFIWVLSKVKVELKRHPCWGEKVRIETWPEGAYKLYASRRFLFKDEKGEALGEAITIWLLLDAHSMRPQRIDSLKLNYHENASKEAFQEMLERVRFQGEDEVSFRHRVSYNDIDINNHVNNAKYVEWIQDCFPARLLSEKPVKAIHLNYVQEAKAEDGIILKKAQDIGNDSCFYLEGTNAETGSSIFEARVELA